jgi:ribosomal protein S18 acetylase RimI-like enzyme
MARHAAGASSVRLCGNGSQSNPAYSVREFIWAIAVLTERRYAFPMSTTLVDVRPARGSDAVGISKVHDEAWTTAYRGIIPPVVLEKMMSRRGPAYWRRLTMRGGAGTLVLIFDGEVAGYATLGPNRVRRLNYGAEIYEIYLKPTHQGVGLGQRLFKEARRVLSANKLDGLVVWALEENVQARRFYSALGGNEVAKTLEPFGDTKLAKIAFAWS